MTNHSTLRSFLEGVTTDWCNVNPASYVVPNSAPASFGDRIRMLVPYNGNDNKTVWGDSLMVPWITVSGMPRDAYPRYVGFFLKAACAWLKVTRPDIHRAVTNGAAYSTIAPIVGVRAGMVADVGLPPESSVSPIGSYLLYDGKRGNLWIKRAAADPTMTLWLDALRGVPQPTPATVEAMLAWCGVAPLVACMSASTSYAVGSSYTVPFVQSAISRHLLAHLRPEGYTAMCLARPLTWDAAMDGTLAGYPEAAARCWATDPLMALCAERRAQDDPAALSHSRAREKETLRKFQRSSGQSQVATESQATDNMWAQVRSARYDVRPIEDDNVSLATGLMEQTEENFLAPGDSVTRLQTAVPSRAPSPPPAMHPQHAQSIRDAARAAQSMAPPAASIMMGVRGEESVTW